MLAPHSRGARLIERQAGKFTVHRFRYAVPPLPEIAYRGEMQRLVFRSPLHMLSLSAFAIGMLSRTVKLSKDVDVVNAHWLLPAGLLSAIPSFLKDKPLVITMHGTDTILFSKLQKLIRFNSFWFRNLVAITVVSNFIAETIRNSIPESIRIEVLPMPVDEGFNPSVRDKVVPDHDIVYVGRLTAQKNVETLLEAVSILKNGYGYKVRLLIIGDGPRHQSLETLAKSLGIAPQVTFRGKVEPDDMPEEMARGRVIALLSIREGFGLSLLEGMKLGLPQIASDDGGAKDIVVHGETGFLTPPRNPHLVAAHIHKLLTDSDLYRHMSMRSVKRGREKFSSESLSRRFESILMEAVERHKA